MTFILNLIKKIIPSKIFSKLQPAYHYAFVLLGAIIYRFPSRQIKVIAVTGTKGKTSTTEILGKILETAGYKVATSSTLQFSLSGKATRNLYKMSMPGRMFMQKFLRQAVNAGCQYAILEMTSEGSRLYRHKFINLDGLIFTNISPEHIESHGSYEKYLEAKLEYAKALNSSPKKNKILVTNAEDKESNKFIQLASQAQKISFSINEAEPYELNDNQSILTFKKETITTRLVGKFNIYNILAAATMAEALGIPPFTIKQALEKIEVIAGRMQKVLSAHPKQDFDVIVDYAHTSDSLTKAYESLGNKKKICVLGSCGGGRDKWKRPQMGKVADTFCDSIILTNEDPYDEDPDKIICDITTSITKPYKKIIDRREAINYAISEAKTNDVVIITGKGTDPYLMEANGKKTPWSDYEVAREEILKVLG